MVNVVNVVGVIDVVDFVDVVDVVDVSTPRNNFSPSFIVLRRPKKVFVLIFELLQ